VIIKVDDSSVKAEPEPDPPTMPTVIPKQEPDETKVTAIPDQSTATVAKLDEAAAAVAPSDQPGVAAVVATPSNQPGAAAVVAAPSNRPGAAVAPSDHPGAAAVVAAPSDHPGAAAAVVAAKLDQPGAAAVVAALSEHPGAAAAKSDQATSTRKEPIGISRNTLPLSRSVSSSSSVPNPLNRPIHPPSTLLPDAEAKIVVSSPIPTVAILPPDVPCPLPAAAFEEKVDPPEEKEMYVAPERKFSINETIRSRGFSHDTDCKSLVPNSWIPDFVVDLSAHIIYSMYFFFSQGDILSFRIVRQAKSHHQ
jgi:hypothetical protein